MEDFKLDTQDFADLFGTKVPDLPAEAQKLIASGDWRYRALEGKERDRVAIDLLERIERSDFSKVVAGDNARWIRGWGENLDEFIKSGGDVSALAPKYIRPRLPLRLHRELVEAQSSSFELDWFRVFQEW